MFSFRAGSQATKLHPVKGRRLKPSQPADVYRNLNKRGIWYSVRQGGKVVAHAKTVLLHDVRFIVSEAGRQRVLRTGRRNVHAFVRGFVRYAEIFQDTQKHRAGYNPRKDESFWVDYKSDFREVDAYRMGIRAAASALLNHNGLTVNEPEVTL